MLGNTVYFHWLSGIDFLLFSFETQSEHHFITPLEATDGGSDIIQPYPNWASILDHPKRCQSELNVFSPQGGTKMNGCGQHTLTCFVSTFCWSDVKLVQWPRNPQGLIIDSSHVLLMLQTSGHLRFHLSNKKTNQMTIPWCLVWLHENTILHRTKRQII